MNTEKIKVIGGLFLLAVGMYTVYRIGIQHANDGKCVKFYAGPFHSDVNC